MKEKIEKVIAALNEASLHFGKVPSDDPSLKAIHSSLVSIVRFPNINVELGLDDTGNVLNVKGDVVSLRKYLSEHIDTFSEKFDNALEPIKADKFPDEQKTVEEVVDDSIQAILKLSRQITLTYKVA